MIKKNKVFLGVLLVLVVILGGGVLFYQSQFQKTTNQALAIAYKDANIEESEVSNLKIKEEIENGKSVYDIDFVDLKNKNEVDYQIDAETGKIIERSRDHMND